jgi:hypothetical protein
MNTEEKDIESKLSPIVTEIIDILHNKELSFWEMVLVAEMIKHTQMVFWLNIIAKDGTFRSKE